MSYRPDRPLMIQSDMTVLVETAHPDYEQIRHRLSAFAELEKTPEHIHTYRITPLSLWNAASAGMQLDDILTLLETYSKFDIAPNVLREIRDSYQRFGLLELVRKDEALLLVSRDAATMKELLQYKTVRALIADTSGDTHAALRPLSRGKLKQELIGLGYPVQDLAGYDEGTPLSMNWRKVTLDGKPFQLRGYQQDASSSFYADGSYAGGNGVLVLPCGAGKTVIGLAAAVAVQAETLVLTSSVTASRQWIREFLDKTSLSPDQIGEYSGESKTVRPVTVATYQILSHRKNKQGEFEHLSLFSERNWGLIIYDEVHMLPAPVFRITADIQAKRRLGLTATLIREDGLEKDVFALIGPKKYDIPWRDLEQQGWIATANCTEIRVELTTQERSEYAVSDERAKARIAAEASGKLNVAVQLAEKHRGDQILIIGQYLDQLEAVAAVLAAPLITGKTPSRERDKLYAAFRCGEIRLLVVSKVANFAIDLPDANVAIQLSGQFGSRQEEAQRLGRILRPKAKGSQASFYSVVTKDTKDQDFALNRQRFLTEQGYRYTILDADEGMDMEQDVQQSIPEVYVSPASNVVSLQQFRKQKAVKG